MNNLIPIGLISAWWILGGLYARRQAVLRNLQEQPGRFQAALKGPIWVREMLVWSTLPPRDFNPEKSSKPSERSRSVNTGPATPAIKEIAGWESPVDKGISGGTPARQEEPLAGLPEPIIPQSLSVPEPVTADIPVNIPQPVIKPEVSVDAPIIQPPVILPEPIVSHGVKPPVIIDSSQNPDLVPTAAPILEDESLKVLVPPKKLPNQPKKKGSVKVLCPTCDKKQKYHADAICPSCNNQNPWLVGYWELITIAPVTPVADQLVEEAVLLTPSGVEKPNRLPGKPMLGTNLKALCPWCKNQQKYKADAVCPSCNNQNPWLAEKWKLKTTSTKTSLPIEPALTMMPEPALESSMSIPEPIIQPELKDTILPEPVLEPAASVDMPLPRSTQNASIPEPIIEPELKDTVLPEPTIEPSTKPAANNRADGNCGGCGRKAMPDLNDNCMFCGNHLGGAE